MNDRRALSFGPFLWGGRVDLGVFVGSAVLPLVLVLARRALGLTGEVTPWAWLVLVVGVDVAHVYSTLFRTYLDGDELRRHPARYALVPLAAYGVGVLLYAHGALLFWRVLAYVALFHFVRQQIGWAAVYRAKDPTTTRLDATLDAVAIYSATLYPVLVWHLDPAGRPFSWFVEGDFLRAPDVARAWLPAARALWGAALLSFVLRQGYLVVRERRLGAGRVVIVGTTAAIWYVGIVASDTDFDFTVTNVVAHGVPYVALLWSYTVAKARTTSRSAVAAVAASGFGAFVLVLLVLAFIEELLWDRLVWGDHPGLFGVGSGPASAALAAWLVPLLATPQATHYALDGVLWRRKDTRENPAQRLALGLDVPAAR